MFWWNDPLAPETLVYAALLAVVAALIIGVMPALKATGPRVQERLKQSTGATSAGLKFGGVWTGVIVTQVAVTVVFLAIVGMLGWSAYVTNGGERQRNFPGQRVRRLRLTLERADLGQRRARSRWMPPIAVSFGARIRSWPAGSLPSRPWPPRPTARACPE